MRVKSIPRENPIPDATMDLMENKCSLSVTGMCIGINNQPNDFGWSLNNMLNLPSMPRVPSEALALKTKFQVVLVSIPLVASPSVMAGGRGKPQWTQSALAITPKAATMMLYLGAPILLLLGCRLNWFWIWWYNFPFLGFCYNLNCVATGCIAVTLSPSQQRWILQMPREHAAQNWLLNTDWAFDFLEWITKSKDHCCSRTCSSWICFVDRSPWPERIVGTSLWLTPKDWLSFSGMVPNRSERKSKPLVVGTYLSVGVTTYFPYGLLPNLNPTHPPINRNIHCTCIQKISRILDHRILPTVSASKPIWAQCRMLHVSACIC